MKISLHVLRYCFVPPLHHSLTKDCTVLFYEELQHFKPNHITGITPAAHLTEDSRIIMIS